MRFYVFYLMFYFAFFLFFAPARHILSHTLLRHTLLFCANALNPHAFFALARHTLSYALNVPVRFVRSLFAPHFFRARTKFTIPTSQATPRVFFFFVCSPVPHSQPRTLRVFLCEVCFFLQVKICVDFER